MAQMTLSSWQLWRPWITGLAIACLVGKVAAIPLSGNDSGVEWRELDREHASPLPLPSTTPLEETSRSGSSTRADSGSVRAHLPNDPYRQFESDQTSSDAVLPSHKFFNQADGAGEANRTTTAPTLSDKSSVNPQNFWSGSEPYKHPAATHESPEEISRTIEEIQRDIAQMVAAAAEMRVDSEGRKSFTLGGIDVFTGPQGSGITLGQGGLSLALVDYDTRRSAAAEMAMLAEQENNGDAKPTFNPIIQLIQWLREIFTYPLFWVFIATVLLGYIATLIIKRRSLKRAQEIYLKHQRVTAPEINRPSSRSKSDHSRPTTSSLPTARPAPEPAKTNEGRKQERSLSPVNSTTANPAANQTLPINPRRTGSIWLKR
ncbi:MAG: hypothetical protein JNL84_09640 [Candidatus Accumulibacter sp.]|nr:hypothetical protein [Accumulibacter sp.]